MNHFPYQQPYPYEDGFREDDERFFFGPFAGGLLGGFLGGAIAPGLYGGGGFYGPRPPYYRPPYYGGYYGGGGYYGRPPYGGFW
ncbi:hypothetical protein H0266_07095 [Halobacillus locisalis]|uniref:Uncharacterized protein n=1 Tax=Halobacillus locisalis TaxID=220753 RepID=A0A838CSU5_9BACI|nr:hypothetical protein [Halobacillus locisalis]MBA2174676.1 hypothetical protein [Halobacillus locisalis]